ncbi:transporter, NhaC family [Natronincola ferrireducens]|uniref:Transporter, NhaC family n=2 Tax=Natronincola ferrireducens TaxID=393762 RepID=A0A1G8Z9D8_9FIRM|nr:transporter, NhaC family [Natronincola ferrireducens]
MKEKKAIKVWQAFLPIITVMFLGLMSVMKWKVGMVTPIIGSITVAVILGMYMGYGWEELQSSLVQGVSRALPALFIMLVVGAIIGSWIAGGVIPTLIYYSLKMISPQIFIPAVAIVTAMIATATGTSFTSIATIGLSLMVTGLGMGFPAPLLAGAIISGAYFGDSISPLSDTTNLSSAMAGCQLFDVIKYLMFTGIPAFVIAVVGYYFVGLKFASQAVMDLGTIETILSGLQSSFTITPLLLLIPIITIFLSIKQYPAIPSLVIIALLGGLAAIVFQGADIATVLKSVTSGFKSQTEVSIVDNLLTRGGITSMGEVVILLTIATSLGGILEKIGALDSILDFIMKKVKTNGELILVTVLSGLAVGFATGAQLLAIVLPARMFTKEYKKRNLHPKNLARTAQSIGTICINLVPWSVPCIFAKNILGVEPIEFIPYLFFPFAIIVIILFYGFAGISMVSLDEEDSKGQLQTN